MGTDTAAGDDEDLSIAERAQRLNAAADAYMAGIITSEEFHAAQARYQPDYRAALSGLAEYLVRTRHHRKRRWYHMFHGFHRTDPDQSQDRVPPEGSPDESPSG